MQLNVCIVGCGDMGRNHANCWKLRDDAQVMAVCDPIEERRVKMADETGATPYPAYREAVLHEGVNVVSVCTPVCFHSEISVLAADNKRHVLCEKPLALTLDQADAAIEAARRNGVLLSTSFQCRGFVRHPKTRSMIRDGEFGGPVFARFTDIRSVRPKPAMHRRSENGGPVIDMAGHYFDLMRWLTGEEPVSVFARGQIFGRGKPSLAEVEDFAVDAADMTVEMTGGHVLNVMVNWGLPEGFGAISEELIVGPEMSLHTVKGRTEVRRGGDPEVWEAPQGDPPGSSVRINDMAESIHEGREPEVTGEDGRVALAVSLAALESIETGEVVRL